MGPGLYLDTHAKTLPMSTHTHTYMTGFLKIEIQDVSGINHLVRCHEDYFL